MSTEAWSCFANLPSGLIDSRSASLTLNWLRPKPTYTGFRLKRDEVDTAKYERNLRVRRQSMTGGVVLAALILVALLVDRTFAIRLFESEMSVFTAVWVATSSVLLALFLFALTSIAVMRYRRAAPRRAAFESACVEFEQIDAWRQARCDVGFWRDRLSEAEFEFEAAELLAGYLKTGQVMLTRAKGDFGVDVLACSPVGRIVALCRPFKGRKLGAGQVLELAGSKAFFEADLGFLLSLEKPASEDGQCATVAAAQKIELWDAARIVAVAQHLRDGNGG
jgi:HJR/Mrr/RecB family endonuclease